jgi:hypothetical protein
MKPSYSSLLTSSGRKSCVSFGENHISMPTGFVGSGVILVFPMITLAF